MPSRMATSVPPCARTMPAARLLAPEPTVAASTRTTLSSPCSRRKQAHQPPTVPPPTTTASALRGSSSVVGRSAVPGSSSRLDTLRRFHRLNRRSMNSDAHRGRSRRGGERDDDPPDACAAGVLRQPSEQLGADSPALPLLVDRDLHLGGLGVVLVADAAGGADATAVEAADGDQRVVVVMVRVEAEADLRIRVRAHDALPCARNVPDARKPGFATAYS